MLEWKILNQRSLITKHLIRLLTNDSSVQGVSLLSARKVVPEQHAWVLGFH